MEQQKQPQGNFQNGQQPRQSPQDQFASQMSQKGSTIGLDQLQKQMQQKQPSNNLPGNASMQQNHSNPVKNMHQGQQLPTGHSPYTINLPPNMQPTRQQQPGTICRSDQQQQQQQLKLQQQLKQQQQQQLNIQQCSCFGIKPSPQTQEPYLRIVEEPQQTGLRFRYQCEGKFAGSIMGASSEGERKTYPEIKIENHSSSAIIVVSCVTRDHPHRPHPHQLVGPNCNDGIFTQRLSNGQTSCVLQNIGIQCCKRSDVGKNLNKRKESRVDPFGTGITEDNIDPCVVRLCFQAFLPDTVTRKFTRILYPVVSQPIFDKKAMRELVICRMSESSCSVSGGKEVFLLCEKVNKDDIMVKFFENDPQGNTVWEGYGKFSSDDVHRQLAIVFKTPPYEHLNISRTVDVYVQLVRPSDGTTSDPKLFHYYPLDGDPYGIERKRQKLTRTGATSGFSADMQKNMAWLQNFSAASAGRFMTTGSNVGGAAMDISSTTEGNTGIIPDFSVLTSQPTGSATQTKNSRRSAASQSTVSRPPYVPTSLPQYTIENLTDAVNLPNRPNNMDDGSQSNDVKPFAQGFSPTMLQFQLEQLQQNQQLQQTLQQQQQQQQQHLQQQLLPELIAEPSTIDFSDIFASSGDDATNTFVDMLDLSPTLLSLSEQSANQMIPSLNFDDLSSDTADLQ